MTWLHVQILAETCNRRLFCNTYNQAEKKKSRGKEEIKTQNFNVR